MKRKGRHTLRRKILFLLLTVILCGGLFFWLGNKVKNFLKENNLVSLSLTTNTQMDQTPIEISSIRQIGQWVFLSVQTEELVDSTRKGIFFDDRIVCIYRGTLSLGINMEKFDKSWVKAQSKDSISLILPLVTLLDQNFINEAQTNVFFEEGTWKESDKERLYLKAKRQMMQRAFTPENRNMAEKHARMQITRLMNAMGFSKVNISFKGETSPKQNTSL